jgi:hypothetical protein
MLEVKKARAGQAGRDPTTAQYVDRMEQGGRPVTLRIDHRRPLVIEDARAYQLLWAAGRSHRDGRGGTRGPGADRAG